MSTKPGVQKPHWNAPQSMKACCTIESAPLASRDSTVVTLLPSTQVAKYRQPDTALSSTSTVQQPHRPCPQLSRAPNRSKRCNNSTRLRCGSISVETFIPLSVKLMVRALIIRPQVGSPLADATRAGPFQP